MEITTLGLAAIIDAQSKGLRLTISEFAVGDGHNYLPDPGMVNLQGTRKYRGSVTNVEQISQHTLQLSCEIPESTDPTYPIRELALFTDTGMMFAIGLVEPESIKEPGLFWRFIVTVNLTTDSSVINVNNHRSLPYVYSVDELDGPQKVNENSVLVGNLVHTNDGNVSGVALRYGGSSEINEWGFLGYTRVLHKISPTVITPSIFKLDTNNGIYNNEKLLVQVVIGDSIGSTRFFTFHDSHTYNNVVHNNVFTLDSGTLYNFDSIDKINIWRNNSNILPSNGSNGQGLMFIDGRPQWGVTSGEFDVSKYLYKLKIIRHPIVGNGLISTFILPRSDSYWSLISIDGVIQNQSSYNIDNDRLIFNSPPCPGTHECALFVPDLTAAMTGSSVELKRERYIVGVTSNPGYSANRLQLLNGPSDANNLFVFHNHTLKNTSEYTYNVATKLITFNQQPFDGITEVCWFEFNSNYDETIVYVTKTGIIGNGSEIVVSVDGTMDNSMLFSSGAYHDTSSYTLTSGSLNIGMSYPGRISEFVVFKTIDPNFTSTLSRDDQYYVALNSQLGRRREGEIRTLNNQPEILIANTWRKLREIQDPYILEIVSNGQNMFDLGVIPKSKMDIRVNVDGKILRMSQFGLQGKKLTLSESLIVGQILEISVSSYWQV
jgi:hypothetical protein